MFKYPLNDDRWNLWLLWIEATFPHFLQDSYCSCIAAPGIGARIQSKSNVFQSFPPISEMVGWKKFPHCSGMPGGYLTSPHTSLTWEWCVRGLTPLLLCLLDCSVCQDDISTGSFLETSESATSVHFTGEADDESEWLACRSEKVYIWSMQPSGIGQWCIQEKETSHIICQSLTN